MSDIRGLVQQKSRGVSADGPYQSLALGRETGGLFAHSLVDSWVRDGRVFVAQNATIGTPVGADAAAAGAIVLTAPAYHFTVPTGLTVVPLRFKAFMNTAAGTVNEFAVVFTDTNVYTSGGTANSGALNMIGGATPRTSQVTNHVDSASAIIVAALTNPRMLDYHAHQRADAVSEPIPSFEYAPLRDGGVLPYIVGPASFIVYIGAVTTAATIQYSSMWAELPTTAVS